MRNLSMLDMGDKFRSLEVLLAAAMEMDWRKADESDIAAELIDIAIQRCRALRQQVDLPGVKHV
ncbi:TPA: hypothetical protein JD824_RS16715 [Citrobacter freundii]|uniref:hypothetical protein n=1 Tax=Citrobacter freundii complex TaxID=1344959 RepID=UPI001753C152|nr:MULTISPECIES: hypothetical protein [Citrobacter freundii complex]HAH9734558.1 hypothetical protein [Escherichia coli]MCY3452183.1 hypothetical protein [Citrobacter freundii]MDE9689860.1 hypothetical protein [Citrobacter portucalensis]HCD1229764.1 hypothetical protein [Citrobacter freundii]HDT6515244.1 hypothetical protein [Citrobacter freundii]